MSSGCWPLDKLDLLEEKVQRGSCVYALDYSASCILSEHTVLSILLMDRLLLSRAVQSRLFIRGGMERNSGSQHKCYSHPRGALFLLMQERGPCQKWEL